MRRVVFSLVSACTVLVHPLSHADTVASWNRIALDTIAQSEQRPEDRLNTMATVNVAMFEALNFVRGRYAPRFVVDSREIRHVSIDAVAAAAAHYVLVNSYPSQEAALDAALRASLDALPDDHARTSGVITGASIAAVVHAARSESPGGALLARDEREADSPASRIRWSGDGKVAQAGRFRSLADPLGWSPIVTELIAVRVFALDESARIHALASIVAAEAHVVSMDNRNWCAPCIAAASVAHILASEVGASGSEIKALDPDREIGRTIARAALLQYYRPLGQPGQP